jgi:hypothetical protein
VPGSIAQHLFQSAGLFVVDLLFVRRSSVTRSPGFAGFFAEIGFYKKPAIVCWPGNRVNVQASALVAPVESSCQIGKLALHLNPATTIWTRM